MPPEIHASGRNMARACPRRHFSIWRKLFYSVSCLMVMLLVGEGALRFRAWIRYGSLSSQGTRSMYVFDPQLRMNVPQPGYKLHGSNIDVSINSLGFRGDDIPRAKPPGTIRIICTGASTTFCEEVSNNDAAWPQQLQKRLRNRYPHRRIEVINAGITGSAIDSSLKDLRGRLLSLDPDLVILYRGNNDIVLDTRTLAISRGLVEESSSQRLGLTAQLAKYSLLVHLVRTNLALQPSVQRRKVTGTLDGIPPDLPDRFIGVLGQIHDELRAHEIPLVLSTFIVKFRRDQTKELQLANARLAFYHMPWASMDDLLDAFATYNQAILQFAQSRNISIVADSDSFPADDPYFADYMHLTDKGCALMADRFADFISENGMIEQLSKSHTQPAEVAP
jgi:lysophospholipase L1-like esterase